MLSWTLAFRIWGGVLGVCCTVWSLRCRMIDLRTRWLFLLTEGLKWKRVYFLFHVLFILSCAISWKQLFSKVCSAGSKEHPSYIHRMTETLSERARGRRMFLSSVLRCAKYKQPSWHGRIMSAAGMQSCVLEMFSNTKSNRELSAALNFAWRTIIKI